MGRTVARVETGALREELGELGDLLGRLAPGDWARPTRCEGWDVADVVLHLAQTNEMATASFSGRYAEVVAELSAGIPPARDVDEGAAAMVARDRQVGAAAVLERWRRSADALAAAAAASDPHARVPWVAGQVSARTLTVTRLAETWIHAGDVAGAVGVEQVPTGRLRPIARLAWRTLPYAFQRAGRNLAGPVAFLLTGPGGDAWDFVPPEEPVTVISGPGAELCLVAARRVPASATGLVGRGPDAPAVLELVRTYA